MRSQMFITFHRESNQIGPPLILNGADAHPDVTDAISWDALINTVAAVYHGFTGQWAGLKDDITKLYENALKEKNQMVNKNNQLELLEGGGIVGRNEQVDEARILFQAWSEDDLTSSFARVDPSDQIQDLGEKRYRKNDENWYEHGFSFPLKNLRAGEYIVSGASGDDGWFFDVGVSSQLNVVVKPRVPDTINRAVLGIFGRAA
ncbi:hypothetical protein [Nitrosospira sp. NRS527]|uniref:hypothetical protein n=1 Tax=Nitrosospira sp. NRS527 TaxID=155925 RepID=UPI001AF26F66|nr:hypothetical protein [Nitrosospira sp. NRS527]BCT69016.1 hypothetical protein NNRS527_02629 [Nitrosospira sp. NRS527]